VRIKDLPQNVLNFILAKKIDVGEIYVFDGIRSEHDGSPDSIELHCMITSEKRRASEIISDPDGYRRGFDFNLWTDVTYYKIGPKGVSRKKFKADQFRKWLVKQ
jgi:hypothetical protein